MTFLKLKRAGRWVRANWFFLTLVGLGWWINYHALAEFCSERMDPTPVSEYAYPWGLGLMKTVLEVRIMFFVGRQLQNLFFGLKLKLKLKLLMILAKLLKR